MITTKFYYCLNPECHFIFKAKILDRPINYCVMCPKCHGTNTIVVDNLDNLSGKRLYNTYSIKEEAQATGKMFKQEGLIASYVVQQDKQDGSFNLYIRKATKQQIIRIKERLNSMKDKYNSIY